MTCIAAIVEHGQVFMGADSCASNGHVYTLQQGKKIFFVGDFLIGFTTSFRMGQLLEYELKVSPPPEDLYPFMVCEFVEKVRELFKRKNFFTRDPADPTMNGGNFIVGVRGHLFEINCDYSVIEHARSYVAIGVGAQHAEGSLHTTQRSSMPPRLRLEQALLAAEAHCDGIRQPFHYLETQPHESRPAAPTQTA